MQGQVPEFQWRGARGLWAVGPPCPVTQRNAVSTHVYAVGGTSDGLPTQGRLEKSRRALAENGGRVGARGSLAGRARAEANASGRRYSWRLPLDPLGECQIKISPRENYPGAEGAAFRVSLVFRLASQAARNRPQFEASSFWQSRL